MEENASSVDVLVRGKYQCHFRYHWRGLKGRVVHSFRRENNVVRIILSD
jgi:hypothetical protein